jgi:hypothetical protein
VKYAGRWIGYGGPITWPPQLPDPSLMNFSCGEIPKEHVYKVISRTIKDLVT